MINFSQEQRLIIHDLFEKATSQNLSIEEIIIFCDQENLDYVSFCNCFSIEIALMYQKKIRSFSYCDGCMMNLMDFMTDKEFSTSIEFIPELAYSIYCAFDEGEYIHDGDSKDIEPAEKYTRPLIDLILKSIN